MVKCYLYLFTLPKGGRSTELVTSEGEDAPFGGEN